MSRTFFALLLTICSTLPVQKVCATSPATAPGTGVTYERAMVDGAVLHVVTVDLTNPRVELRVVPGDEDPDGGGRWETKLLQVTKIAEREKFDVAINGDYFAVEQKADDPGAAFQGAYVAGASANILGPGVTDGKTWAPANSFRAAFVIDRDGRARVNYDHATPVPPGTKQAIGGSEFIDKGKLLPWVKGGVRGALTAIGADPGGTKVFMAVVDGPREGYSAGLTHAALAAELIKRGCAGAVMLDGGGSSTLVMRDDAGKLRTTNRPTDGKLRPVASAIGVRVRGE